MLPARSARTRGRVATAATLAVAVGMAVLSGPAATPASAAQPATGHTRLVPEKPRTDMPRISDGRILDIEVIGNRVFVAGTFTSIANTTGATAPVAQRYLAAYDIDTGRIDTSFRPTFDGLVNAVEASPDGTKLFVGGTFNTVDGQTRRKVVSLNPTSGAPRSAFATTASTNRPVTALAATDDTLYVGGKFTRINGQVLSGLAALDAVSGQVDLSFDNQITGGIGSRGALTVPQLRLTHDESKLLVAHTGRQIDGQDRLGVGIIDTGTQALLPWRSRLWDDYLPIVGGVQRISSADISPDDSYFVVGSGSGGDRPPISDTALAFSLDGGDFTEPLWVSRTFDSIYSIAITEQAVYLGGHFNWLESPTSNQPWPGLDNVGYGWGQGLSGYALGDQVVRREHIGSLDPRTGVALEWSPESNSFKGNEAMLATDRGLFVGGDGMFQGGVRTGRVAFYDFQTVPTPTDTDTTIVTPIEGRVEPAGEEFAVTGTARAPGGVQRVQVSVQDRDTNRYLQDDLATWGGWNTINADLGEPAGGTTPWSLALTVDDSRELLIRAKAYGNNGTNDTTQAQKKIETFRFDDQTPTTRISGPGTIQTSPTFTVTGTASDDQGVTAVTVWFRDEQQRYLQDDGTLSPIFNTVSVVPDVVGASEATWSYEVTLPAEGRWRASATAIDTAGQADLRGNTRDWVVGPDAGEPLVVMDQPVQVTPPLPVSTLQVTPGGPLAFSGTAFDDNSLQRVEIRLQNLTTEENLGSDGAWGKGVRRGWYRVSPVDINDTSHSWSYTTPFALAPGVYSFEARAVDKDGLRTSSSNRVRLTIDAQVPGDFAPDGLLDLSGDQATTSPELTLTGTATDDIGVAAVEVKVFDNDTGRYLQADGSMTSDYSRLAATLAEENAASTAWSLPLTLPGPGDYSITAFAVDSSGQTDLSRSGATARYRFFPGDNPPVFDEALGQPTDGTSFGEGTIVVTGRAIDDVSIARVDVAVINADGQYMSSSGSFTSTSESWRGAFLTSPGSLGSNFSYTTPVIPDGTYTVLVRPGDGKGQYGAPRTAVGVSVTSPSNEPPKPVATVSCDENVCAFDGRDSEDENPAGLTYAWEFGEGQGSGSGPVPTTTYSSPGTFTVTLTVRDQWNLTATTSLEVTIAEPSGNRAPEPELITSCTDLRCSVSAARTTDPDDGDTLEYQWSWGDGSPESTGSNSSHTYASAGTYTVTLTATDGWGRSASDSTQVTVEGGAPVSAAAFRAGDTASVNARSVQVDVPAAVEEGDGLLLVVSGNRADTDYSGPGAGWQKVTDVADGSLVTNVWQRVASSGDAGSPVVVDASQRTKMVAQLVAYEGTSAEGPVLTSATDIETTSRAEHATPTVAAPAGAVVVSYWADRTSSTTSWTVEDGLTVRADTAGVGGGRITAVMADEGPTADAGTVGDRTATADSSSGRAVMLTLVLG